MYQYHPTIIDRFSSFSVSEQVIWVRGIASGGNATGSWAVKNTPQPEAYGLRVAQVIIVISSARVYSIIQIRIEYTPSSEPDDWRTACIPLTVFKPIKDGINNWLKIDIK